MTKKVTKTKKKEITLKLYEAIFIGAAVILLIFVVLYKYVTPNL